MIYKIFLFLTLILVLSSMGMASAYLISDQGTSVRNLTGSLLDNGNLTIIIYNSPAGGNIVFNSTIQNAIINGSWNLMINPTIEYGISYWKDYEINGEDLDFDGNERLEFQSSLGYINNASFVNFSLINSCASGSSIRLIYPNGSVECESDDSGNGTAPDLTNYALKNQSETFAGNITTSFTGFFGWLGSLTNRITKLFVSDIDASGNVTASYFKGDGSLLTNLPAGSESDPIFVAENTTLWGAINSKLSQGDQRYNDTALIVSVNRTTNIMSLGFYNKSEVDGLISAVGAGNLSFNQTLTDMLYYSINNPLNFINHTLASVYNDTNLILTTNSSLWNYINSNFGNWNSTFNSTYNNILGQQCSAGMVVNGTLLNGTLSCITDSTGSGSGNIFNQVLNTTSNVTFANITIISNSAFSGNVSASTGFFSFLGSALSRITKLFTVDLDVSNNISAAGNVSAQFYFGSLNRSTFPTSSCSGTDKVTSLLANGSVACASDETGSPGEQTIPVKFMNVLAGAVTDTNAPAAERIVGNSYYLVCTNATRYSRFRYGYARAATNGGANAIVYMKYIAAPATTITGSSYTNLSNSSSQILSYTSSNTADLSAYYTMDSNLEDICIGAFQAGGSGSLDPQWRNIWIELS